MAAANPKPNKLAFLSMPAPASYVAGLGRGASGFTTRSDIGPAREGPSAEAIAEAQAKRGEEQQEFDPDAFQDPDNEVGLFSSLPHNEDDEEADNIYASVDEAMDSRRKRQREEREKAEAERVRREQPKIQAQFADLKRGLSAVTDEEWDGIPEVGNLTRRKRKKIGEGRAFAVPDSVLVGNRAQGEMSNTAMDVDSQDGAMTNFVDIGDASKKVLTLRLDQMGTSTGASGTATSVDPKGYLTSLDSVILKSDAEIGDIKRARTLFDSLVKSNPKHAPGWIAAACLEEHAGRMVAARKIIKQGCEVCPKSDDVWLEAARLHNPSDAKIILANAVQHVPTSVKIWLAAADLEGSGPTSIPARRQIMRRALEHIPNSIRLWKETVNLEDNPADARLLLGRAVEVIPKSVELWLALARLESPGEARKVLNKARKAVPTSHEIWIAAGRLVEEGANGPNKDAELEKVDKTIEMAVSSLRKHQVLLTREQWLKEAEKCEQDGSLRTCEAIVKATISLDLSDADPDSLLDTYLSDSQSSIASGHVHTARAVLAQALLLFPSSSTLWHEAADLEKAHSSSPDALVKLLDRANQHCPQDEVMWLMNAKERWLGMNDVSGARDVLAAAFNRNPESEQIWLAAIKVEDETGEAGLARQLLERARGVAGTPRIWLKSATFERLHGNPTETLKLLSEALTKYPTQLAKLYMIQGQVHQYDLQPPSYSNARASYAAGMKHCPKEPVLWILASRLEEVDGKSIRARAILEKGRTLNPTSELIWHESVLVEERNSSAVQAKQLLSRALQALPASGLLWSLAIMSEARPQRKARSVDALKKASEDPWVVCCVARLFWAERKVEKARTWFERAVSSEAGSDLGDLWAWWLKFERQHGGTGKKQEGGEEANERAENVVNKCIEKDPKHGLLWPAIRKDVKNRALDTRHILIKVAEELK
ncbi:PRP1 splicing factor, N-terminal-domain-containing protein [Flagelloscypha sp. PMI_526]|nr:PRP1 splicing factor, N-terminal-domain-containing protein [Flagelloscypha sp. PMI_526]